MTHERDLDRVLDRWMDAGPTVVADRVIATAMTDVHTTRQRGARSALLKELFMTLKPAAMIVAATLVAVLGIAAYQIFWTGGLIGTPPAPRMVAASELPEIVLDADGAPPGMNLDGIYTDGNDVLLRPLVSVEGSDTDVYLSQQGFLGGRYTEFSDDQSGLLSWAALFETAEDAEQSLALYVDELQSEDGYGMTRRVDVVLGDEGSSYTEGNDPAFNAQVYLWRVGNVVMAAATYGDFDPNHLRQIAQEMDDRAQ